MGGMSGRLELAFPEPPSADWLQQAILAQYTGIGQRVAFGFGRYRLCADSDNQSMDIRGERLAQRPVT